MMNGHGFSALMSVAVDLTNDDVKMVQWLLEHGRADIADTTPDGDSVCDLLEEIL
jgi:hypothetical protein